MKIAHHPDDATLMSFAAGSLPASLAAVIAGHIDLCPRCTREMRLHEAIGAVVLSSVEPSRLERAVPMLAASTSEASVAASGTRRGPQEPTEIPRALLTFVGPVLDELPWQRLGRDIMEHQVELPGTRPARLVILKVEPGGTIPNHGHGGAELTLVLRGGYSDATGHYTRGDVADLDANAVHAPMADPEGCICVVASETAPRFSSPLVRLWRRVRRPRRPLPERNRLP